MSLSHTNVSAPVGARASTTRFVIRFFIPLPLAVLPGEAPGKHRTSNSGKPTATACNRKVCTARVFRTSGNALKRWPPHSQCGGRGFESSCGTTHLKRKRDFAPAPPSGALARRLGDHMLATTRDLPQGAMPFPSRSGFLSRGCSTGRQRTAPDRAAATVGCRRGPTAGCHSTGRALKICTLSGSSWIIGPSGERGPFNCSCSGQACSTRQRIGSRRQQSCRGLEDSIAHARTRKGQMLRCLSPSLRVEIMPQSQPLQTGHQLEFPFHC
jgi:hypothetical protein